jgi:hypothetical protein
MKEPFDFGIAGACVVAGMLAGGLIVSIGSIQSHEWPHLGLKLTTPMGAEINCVDRHDHIEVETVNQTVAAVRCVPGSGGAK